VSTGAGILEFQDRGARRPPIGLPENARVCFTVDLGFEGFTRACQYRLRPVGPDQVDRYSLSFAEYGLRVGIWRLLELADELKLVTGVAVNGYAAERYPKTLRAVSDAGHEIIAHGWTNDAGVASEDEATERAEIARTQQAIRAATGQQPVGWVSPGYAGSAARLKALAAACFLYSCDDAGDDLPYVIQLDTKPHVIMPRTSFGSNDLTNWFAPRHAPATWLSAFKSQFDTIYAEAMRGRPGWMELFLHAHFAGRTQALQEIREMIGYVRGHDGIWLATRGAFARWILDHPEYHGP
jgi:peptidoglycan/xylan/chitin deacetylase (PgdA/CDA1 family)